MTSVLIYAARSGVVALIVLSFIPFSASAARIGLIAPAVTDSAANVLQAQADQSYRGTLPILTHKAHTTHADGSTGVAAAAVAPVSP